MSAEAVLVERGADRADAPVHHVARRDDVGAGAGLRDRGARQQLDARVVVDRAVGAQQAAVAVARVLAQAHVGDDEQVGVGVLDRARGELDDALVVPGARALLVLVGGDAEQQHGGDAERVRPRRPPRRRAAIDRRSTPGIARDRRCGRRGPPRRTAAGRSRRRQPRLAHEVAQHRRAAQAAQARLREGHAYMVGHRRP